MPKHSTPKPCSVPGCAAPYRCSGFCDRHYQRWIKYKNLHEVQYGRKAKLPTVEERFWAHTKRVDACLIWTGTKNRTGYGVMSVKGRNRFAHRISIEIYTGEPFPPGVQTCHNCPGGDNKLCVEPTHLFLGTPKEHGVDRAAKGQAPSGARHPLRRHPEWAARGARQGKAKFTDADVMRIRHRYAEGEIGCYRLAKEYGLDKSTVQALLNGKTWKHLPIVVPTSGHVRERGWGTRRLREQDVLDIRARAATGSINMEDTARTLGVCVASIYNVISRRTWTHI